MFILRQLTTKINTNVASITVISVLLLFTIVILSTSISITNVYNSNLERNNVSDFTLNETFYSLGEPKTLHLSSLISEAPFQKAVKDFVLYEVYESEDVTLENLLTPATKQQIRADEPSVSFDVPIPLMKESDFHRLMEVMNQPDFIIDITPQQYLLAANLNQMIGYYQPTLQEHLPLNIQ
jgi:putative ABC transport system permease protein